MKKLILLLFVPLIGVSQTFDFSCAPPITYTELEGVYSRAECPEYSYTIDGPKVIAQVTVYEVNFFGFVANKFLASTEAKAHIFAQSKINAICEQ